MKRFVSLLLVLCMLLGTAWSEEEVYVCAHEHTSVRSVATDEYISATYIDNDTCRVESIYAREWLYCEDCGEYLEELGYETHLEDIKHIWVDGVCIFCGHEQPCEHSYEMTSVSPANCTTDGKQVETCSKCGDVRETVLSATGHIWQDGVLWMDR